MAGTVTFGGLGSGLDTESIVSGLVQANRGTANRIKQKVTENQSAVSALSDIGSLLSKLKSASDALSSSDGVASYKVTSSNAAIVTNTAGQAKPGSFDIIVDHLAKEQRTYSNAFNSSSALNQTGTLQIQVGTGNPINIDINTSDNLDNIASKINASGGRVSASVIYDGVSQYKLQVRGRDTGSANALTFTESGVNLGLNVGANTYQSAQDSEIHVDGMSIKRPTNQISGVIGGVNLALTAETTTAVKVTIDSEAKGLSDKLKSFVDAYNGVVSKVQQTAGYGSLKAQQQALAGDATLRGITAKLSASITQPVTGAGSYTSLGAIGVSITRDGRMSLDTAKFEKALAQDQGAVEKILSGTTVDSTTGIMDVVSNTVDTFTKSSSGTLSQRKEAFDKKITDLNKQMDREEVRLQQYADRLRKQFTQMDSTVGAYKSQGDYLNRFTTGR